MDNFFTLFQHHSVPLNYFNKDIVHLPMKLPFITFLLGGRGNIINVMPQMANLGKGCLKLGQATCLYIFLYGAPWDILHIFLFMCFASSHYYSSTKHLISLLPKTTPRDRFLSGLWKIFQTTQSHPSDFSQLSYYKTKIVQTRFLYTEVHYSDFRWKDLGPSASTIETSAFRFGGAIFIPQIITKIGVVRKVHYFLPSFLCSSHAVLTFFLVSNII